MILETTGLADPAPVAFTFFANPWIASRFRLDSIVCVCDTRYVLQVSGELGAGLAMWDGNWQVGWELAGRCCVCMCACDTRDVLQVRKGGRGVGAGEAGWEQAGRCCVCMVVCDTRDVGQRGQVLERGPPAWEGLAAW